MQTIKQAVDALALAAQQAGLLHGALTSGFLTQVGDGAEVRTLALRTGLAPDRVRALCVALAAAGVLERDGAERYRLSPSWAPVPHDGLDAQLANQLGNITVRGRLYAQMFRPQGPDRYDELPAADRLAIAAGSSQVSSSPLAQNALRASLRRRPVFADALDAGDVRVLELGCGLSGHLLTILHLYPRVTAVAVDTQAELLERAAADAAALGVADRVRYVHGDATLFTDPEPFDLVFWSQFFFPAATREKALATALHQLRPGGLLVLPVAIVEGPDDPHDALRSLLLHSWGVPTRTAEELCAEVAAAGFAAPTAYAPGSVLAHRP
ncbi:hypothetical protein Val02_04970 [Virgisporangium aliadipatigenens]|uniref:Methyltransferase domain-containing protein n=1 Tax=Virgisporangium aliadipatigenens TaxID=741659 RepID=A0A8J3YGM1_9ACTN|nr:class I SAM-dependent methyltransferase [Virgisporangium aliadipatigenens]GIJ43611.1 hypothetical protein Val02_04970 [Virgisporangium aliadipatigenens]